jgi:DNA-binding NarL/FixJ family response regulator
MDAPTLNNARPIRVLLADDHALLRRGLAEFLREHDDLEVVGEASDGQEAVELAFQTRPDVVLMDVTMPKLSGLEATEQIMACLPKTYIIGLSMHEGWDMAAAMCAAGARAYLSKSQDSGILIDAVYASRSAA